MLIRPWKGFRISFLSCIRIQQSDREFRAPFREAALLFEQVGITCYNVTGKCSRENHMWNIARIDGQWLWFDATSDRGLTPDSFRQFALTELDTERYTWEQSWVDVLLK